MRTGRAFVVWIRVAVLLTLGWIDPCHALEFVLSDEWCEVDNATRLVCDTTSHRVYVTSPLDEKIVVFDAGGDVVDEILLNGPPGAVCLAEPGRLIVTIENAVYKIDMDGAVLTTYGAGFVDPHDVVWVPDGRVYVLDEDDSVKVFEATGAPLFSFGGHGYYLGRLDEPVAAAYNFVTNELIVNDQNNYRIQSFALDGDSLFHWGSEGSNLASTGVFLRPFGLDIDAGGRIWVLDMISDVVQIFDRDGIYLNKARLQTLQLRCGVDIAVDGNVLYVTSPSTGCVHVYSVVGGVSPTPQQPLSLTIWPTDAGLKLDWISRPLDVQYVVERCAELDFPDGLVEVLTTTTNTTFTDADAASLYDVCYYRVIAETAPGTPGILREESDERFVRDPLDQPHDDPHEISESISCNSCHTRPLIIPQPKPDWWTNDHMCKSCHVETGFATPVQSHLGSDTLTCSICHNPHFHQPQYERYFIRNGNPVDDSEHMLFNHATDFIHGAPNYDGICEICHTQTTYYRNDGSGTEHNAGSNCLDCHSHWNGFMPNVNLQRVERR
jgi:sugar lactone lactonase YvrE